MVCRGGRHVPDHSCDFSDDSHDDISFEDHQFSVITFEKFHFLAFFLKVLFPFLVTLSPLNYIGYCQAKKEEVIR
jgi:hypothetical protein